MKRVLVALVGLLGVTAAMTAGESRAAAAPPALEPAPARRAELPPIARLELLYRVGDGDTATHVDLVVGRTVTIGVRAFGFDGRPVGLTAAQVKWTTGNAGVAKVTNAGVVTARARGYATLTAIVGSVGQSVRACVATTDRELVPIAQTAGVLVPGLATIRARSTLPMSARLSFKTTGSTQWGPCAHWSIDESSRAWASIDRSGNLRASRMGTIGTVAASIGPRVR